MPLNMTMQVLLVGGGTRMPAFRRVVQHMTGLEPATFVQPDEVSPSRFPADQSCWLPVIFFSFFFCMQCSSSMQRKTLQTLTWHIALLHVTMVHGLPVCCTLGDLRSLHVLHIM